VDSSASFGEAASQEPESGRAVFCASGPSAEECVAKLEGKVAWVTGAGSGIGEAGAVALAHLGAAVVLTGRRRQPLEAVAERINGSGGGAATARPGDLTKAATVMKIAEAIGSEHGRIDIVVNNAGINIADRSWGRLTPDGIDTVIAGNLTSAFYVVQAALPIMRAQKGGLFIHTASWAGRWIGPVSGPAYTAAKHGMVAMSHTINLEECGNGIRSTVLCPGEVATPILLNRPIPETPETMGRMIQPQDMGALIAFVASQPAHVCINEVLISPTHNRGYLSTMQARAAAAAQAAKG
jgi:NAD(P)-dependent dehydrogenase (short-subunit alcohol dehydrogenase family)